MFDLFIKNLELKNKIENKKRSVEQRLYQLERWKENIFCLPAENKYDEDHGFYFIISVMFMFLFFLFILSFLLPILNNVVAFSFIFMVLYSIVYFCSMMVIVKNKIHFFKLKRDLKNIDSYFDKEITNEELFYEIVSNINKVNDANLLKKIEKYLENSDSAIKCFKAKKEEDERIEKEKQYKEEKIRLKQVEEKKEEIKKLKNIQNQIKNKYVRIQNIN